MVSAGTAHITITAAETSTYKAAEKTITITVKETEKKDTENSVPEVGATLKSGKDSNKVTKAGSEVAFTKTINKAAAITIPATVSIDNVTYKATSIAAIRNSRIWLVFADTEP